MLPHAAQGIILFFPSAFQHMALATDGTPHNDGLVDIRFATARSALDDATYPPTRDGRAPFIPLGAPLDQIRPLAPGWLAGRLPPSPPPMLLPLRGAVISQEHPNQQQHCSDISALT